MGNQRQYIEGGGFSEHLYDDHPGYETFYHNGMKAKVILLKADPDGNHAGLPPFADTSDIYLRVGKTGNVIQAKVYVDRKHSLDFDWGHEHKRACAKEQSPVSQPEVHKKKSHYPARRAQDKG